jgi:hypothetical protein
MMTQQPFFSMCKCILLKVKGVSVSVQGLCTVVACLGRITACTNCFLLNVWNSNTFVIFCILSALKLASTNKVLNSQLLFLNLRKINKCLSICRNNSFLNIIWIDKRRSYCTLVRLTFFCKLFDWWKQPTIISHNRIFYSIFQHR